MIDLTNLASCIVEPPPLLYYTHIPTALISLLIGFFVESHNRKSVAARTLLYISILFAFWVSLSIFVWTSTNAIAITMAWSFFGMITAGIFLLCIRFVYAYCHNGDAPLRVQAVWLLLFLPVLLLARLATDTFSLTDCEVVEDPAYIAYYYLLGVVAIVWITALIIRSWRHASTGDNRKQLTLLAGGIICFIVAFFVTGYVSVLFNNYSIEQYGLFGMTIFMILLAFIIVRFRAFNIKLIGTQALVWTLIIILGSQFFYINGVTDLILTVATFVMAAISGFFLVRGVKREVALREHLEIANRDLEKAYAAQADTTRFIHHQIGGYFTNAKFGLSNVIEGDFGELVPEIKAILTTVISGLNEGVLSVQAFMSVSKFDSGENPCRMDPLDFRALTQTVSDRLSPKAKSKGLEYIVDIPATGNYAMIGDKTYLSNALGNLIDNAIRYTPTGSVKVSLSITQGGAALFAVKDTGIGITEEDMGNLFTKYGHGKKSREINVDSNGLGLYLVKKIIEAHGGRVWAETELGKGTTFFATLPLQPTPTLSA